MFCELTCKLFSIVTSHLISFTAEREILQDIKERLCFVSQNFAKDMQKCAKSSSELDHKYVLPDGQTLTLGSERFRCPELLLRPDFVNLEEPGYHVSNVIHNSCKQQIAFPFFFFVCVCVCIYLINSFLVQRLQLSFQ